MSIKVLLPAVEIEVVSENGSSESVIMRIDCPQCGQSMFVKVGLNPDTARNQVECIGCKSLVVALVPGPVMGPPWKADSARLAASTCILVESERSSRC